VDNTESHCETSFDETLLRIKDINRLPWVGKNYKKQSYKTLILGESVYDWNPADSSSIGRISDSYNLRKLHKALAFDFNQNARFIRNIERAIYSKRNPTNEEKAHLWNSVVYHNLVCRVLETNRHRPSYDDYYTGWKVFDKLTTVFDIDQVIVYGLESPKIIAFNSYYKDIGILPVQTSNLCKVGRTKPKKYIIEKDGKDINILFIRHPSAFFSWRKWSTVIQSEMAVSGEIS
tara:strand:- start:542 stop:1240 length:699 start_codon:yes stop_codon:yes gene_type:complete